MPDVLLDLEIRAPIEKVWEKVVDIESYPDSMESVRWVKIRERHSDSVRRAAWSVLLKGSILEWEEEEHLDHEAHTIVFHQLSGDLELFDGRWALESEAPDRTTVVFQVSFEIGIPLLADMLNPVAERSLRDNCTEMLRGIERGSIAA